MSLGIITLARIARSPSSTCLLSTAYSRTLTYGIIFRRASPSLSSLALSLQLVTVASEEGRRSGRRTNEAAGREVCTLRLLELLHRLATRLFWMDCRLIPRKGYALRVLLLVQTRRGPLLLCSGLSSLLLWIEDHLLSYAYALTIAQNECRLRGGAELLLSWFPIDECYFQAIIGLL